MKDPQNVTITDEIADEGWEYENTTIVDTRRILYSKRVSVGKRPYMVIFLTTFISFYTN